MNSKKTRGARSTTILVSITVLVVVASLVSAFVVINNSGLLSTSSQNKSNVVSCLVQSYQVVAIASVYSESNGSESTSQGTTTWYSVDNVTTTINPSETIGYTTTSNTNISGQPVIAAWQVYSCTYIAQEAPPTNLLPTTTCTNCLQGGTVPAIPYSILSVDGVSYNSYPSMIAWKAGTSHEIYAPQNYTTICQGYPCNGANMTLRFVSWEATIFYPANGSNGCGCTAYSLPNPDEDPLMIKAPTLGWGGSLQITAVYKLVAWGNTTY